MGGESTFELDGPKDQSSNHSSDLKRHAAGTTAQEALRHDFSTRVLIETPVYRPLISAVSDSSRSLETASTDSLQTSRSPKLIETSSTSASDDGTMARFGKITWEGVKNLPKGALGALYDDIVVHPLQTLGTVAGSAVLGAALKTGLPEKGPAGLIAGLAIGAYFTYEAAQPVKEAYQKGFAATNDQELDAAGQALGRAVGDFAVNSAFAYGGYKLGAYGAKRALSAERFDGFADAKDQFWKAADRGYYSMKGKLGMSVPPEHINTAATVGIASHIKIEGERAQLLKTERVAPKGVIEGIADPNQQMSVTVMLKSRGSDLLLDRHLNRIATGKSGFLTDAEIQSKFGADPKSLDRLTRFANDHGLTVTESDLTSGRVVLSGKTGDFGTAFDVNLKEYQHPAGFRYRGRVGTLSVPTEIAGDIEGVFGLDNRPQARSYIRRLGKPEGNAAGAVPHRQTSYMPDEVADMYNFPKDSMGAGRSVAIVELGGGLDAADNSLYYKQHGLKEPKINVVELGEAKNSPGDPSGADGEVALDSQIIGAVAPDATQMLIFAENSDKGFLDSITRSTFTKPGETPNDAISISWGNPESNWTAQAMRNMDLAFKKAALKGISIFAASGDDGALDGARTFQTDFPSSSPWATGTGGTRLIGSNGKIESEVAWNNGPHSGAGGGGISETFPPPDYQAKVELPVNANKTGKPGRGVPDIAGDADPVTGYRIRVGGQEEITGGTSAVSPLYSALTVRITGVTGKPLGFINPFLYENADSGIFNDIIRGNNNGYPTGKGWDAVTGLGSINGIKLLERIRANGGTTVKGSNFTPTIPPAIPQGESKQH